MNRNTFNEILHRIYRSGLSIQSNQARIYDQEIAAMASSGLITTKEAPPHIRAYLENNGRGSGPPP